jgi:hypothetical protein
MKPHELTLTIENFLIGWRLEWSKLDKVVGMYEGMAHPDDIARYGKDGVLGNDGRKIKARYEYLDKLITYADQGLIYRENGDMFTAIDQRSQFYDMINEANHQGREVWESTAA